MANPKHNAIEEEHVAQQVKGIGAVQEIDQGNQAVLLDVSAAGKDGANLKLAKDGHVSLLACLFKAFGPNKIPRLSLSPSHPTTTTIR